MSSTLFEAPQASLALARERFARLRIKQPKPDLQRDSQHGWLPPALVDMDDEIWKRWTYWAQCTENQALPDALIPRLGIFDFPHAQTRKMLEASLNCIP